MHRPASAALLILLVAGVAWLSPALAQACACCGSQMSASVVGWSGDGRQLVLNRSVDATCFINDVYEVWTVGADSPAYCMGAYTEDPTAKLDCGDATGTDPNGAVPAEHKTLRLPAGFEPATPTLAPGQVLAWGREFEGEETTQYAFELQVLSSGGFRRVKTRDYAPSLDDSTLPDTLAVWPAPRGRKGVMLVREYVGSDDSVVQLIWVTLPQRGERHALTEEATWVSIRHPPTPMDDDTDYEDDRNRVLSARRLARSRVYERIGDLPVALQGAESAIGLAPTWMPAWMFYTRMLALSGRHEQAIAILERIDALPCAPCREAVRSAVGEPAFDVLRERRSFARLGGPR